MSHLVVCITAHGYGHAAQLAPVVNSLRSYLPQLSLTLRTQLPQAFLASRFAGEFALVDAQHDFGMEMASAIDVLAQASAERYAAVHAQWDKLVDDEARALDHMKADFVLSGVGYVPLAAAARQGIRAAALSSLSWFDIFTHYCGAMPGTQTVLDHMNRAYASAPFIQVEPALPMRWHPQCFPVGPVARVSQSRRETLRERLHAGAGPRIVLVTLGGMDMRLPVADWPAVPDLYWIVPKHWGVRRADIANFEDLGLPFSDVLSSCDALLTKPGYGAFVEAACNGIPVIYVERPDWPESPYLIRWLHAHARAAAVTRSGLLKGQFMETLAALWAQQPPPVPMPTGAVQAAELIATWLKN